MPFTLKKRERQKQSEEEKTFYYSPFKWRFRFVSLFTNKMTLMKRISIALFIMTTALFCSCSKQKEEVTPEMDSSSFVLVSDVVPDAILEIRYFSTYNFIGERIPGYEEPVAILTHQAADSLKAVSDELLQQGYRLKIFDAYRPQCAVDFFMKWAKDSTDVRMKEYFYPELEKTVLVPEEYVAEKSGHTRGSTIDLTLFDMRLEKEVDMGCTYDYFGLASHPDVLPGQEVGAYKPINETQYKNRMILRQAMLRHGFKPYDCEWWHFTLKDEPFPDTYFEFPIKTESIRL